MSGDATRRDDVIRMSKWLKDQLEDLGVTTNSVDLGQQTGGTLELPPIILGRIGDDSTKKTVLVYGHYDVQPVSAQFQTFGKYSTGMLGNVRPASQLGRGSIPMAHWSILGRLLFPIYAILLVIHKNFNQAQESDGWGSDPFKLVVEEDGRLVGRGSTDDKGPILGWLNVLQAHKALGRELPVNLRFCFEGMEESGSEGLDDFIKVEAAKGKDGWFDGVDCVCISDNYWLNARTPCLTYGLRGIVYFEVNVTGPDHDLHSGMFGRMVHEPMTDLIALMGTLVASDGTILIPGVEELVPDVTPEER